MARIRRRQPNDLKNIHDRRAGESNRGVENYLTPKEVEDPYEQGAKIIVMRNTRDDPLASLHARNHIDEAQYHGGRAFQHDFETAERGPRAIDPSKEAVDGGRMPEMLTDHQRDAVVRLARADKKLGENGSILARNVLIHGMTVKQIGALRGQASEIELKYIGRRFRECLDCLAVIYGFAMERR